MKLYEITDKYREFMYLAEDGEFDEQTMQDTLEAIGDEFDAKAENVACLVKELRAEANAIKQERDKLAQRQKTKEQQADWLENYLDKCMRIMNISKIETPRARIRFTKGERVEITVSEDAFISWAKANADDLLTYKQPEINKTNIKAALKQGRDVFGAAIEKTSRARVG